jgi:hypothetical protein
MGLLGMLVVTIMAGVYIMAAIRLIPSYIEYLTVRDVTMVVAEEFKPGVDSASDIRRALAGYLNTNQVKAITERDTVIRREQGKLYIDNSYEDRIPLFWRIDLVMRYDDLVFEAGIRHSDD